MSIAMHDRSYRLRIAFLLVVAFGVMLPNDTQAAGPKRNLLIITVDDMSCDSLGSFGCKLPDTSPNIDALSKQGMKFHKAHVVVGNCFPSRNVMWSGLYPHNTGVEGFFQVPDAQHLHLADLMKQNGYYTGILHKVSHSTPYHPYPAWDVDLTTDPNGKSRDIKAAISYRDGTAQGIEEARQAGKPFCLVMNISDPHKPFYAQGNRGQTIPDVNVPSKVFTPEEVPVPGFLFDDPVVRKELAHYYSSVRRADDCVGAILKALDESGQKEYTSILFLSDHGMPLPFAKTQVYHHSSHTPMFMIVPGITKPETADRQHMVSAVDILPTLLEINNIQHPKRMDGRSFAALLKGETQTNRDFVVKEYHENSGGSRDPMRSLQTSKYLYIFNPWSNGSRIMATATTGTPTYRRMAELSRTDSNIAARHDLYQHRVPEELYDIQNDPDCIHNLLSSPEHKADLNALRSRLEQWMIDTKDDMLTVFRSRDDAAAREAYVVAQEKQAEARKANKNKGKNNEARSNNAKASQSNAPAPKRRQRSNLIEMIVPDSVAAGKPVTVRIKHTLPSSANEQTLTLTMKGGTNGVRIERKTVIATGDGVTEVTFDVPAEVPGGIVSFAAFVGEDFQSSLQHLQSDPVPAK